MELGGPLPQSQVSTTCPYPSQINPFLCPSPFWQAQLVSFLVQLQTYQHPGIKMLENSESFSHTGHTLEKLDAEARTEVFKLGGNSLLEDVMDELLDRKRDTDEKNPEQ